MACRSNKFEDSEPRCEIELPRNIQARFLAEKEQEDGLSLA